MRLFNVTVKSGCDERVCVERVAKELPSMDGSYFSMDGRESKKENRTNVRM